MIILIPEHSQYIMAVFVVVFVMRYFSVFIFFVFFNDKAFNNFYMFLAVRDLLYICVFTFVF